MFLWHHAEVAKIKVWTLHYPMWNQHHSGPPQFNDNFDKLCGWARGNFEIFWHSCIIVNHSTLLNDRSKCNVATRVMTTLALTWMGLLHRYLEPGQHPLGVSAQSQSSNQILLGSILTGMFQMSYGFCCYIVHVGQPPIRFYTQMQLSLIPSSILIIVLVYIINGVLSF